MTYYLQSVLLFYTYSLSAYFEQKHLTQDDVVCGDIRRNMLGKVHSLATPVTFLLSTFKTIILLLRIKIFKYKLLFRKDHLALPELTGIQL